MVFKVLNHLDVNDTAMWLKVSIGLALMPISWPGILGRIRWLAYISFLAGLELVLWALLAPGIYWPWAAIAATVAVVALMVPDYQYRTDSEDHGPAVDIEGGSYHAKDSPISGFRKAIRAKNTAVRLIKSPIKRRRWW